MERRSARSIFFDSTLSIFSCRKTDTLSHFPTLRSWQWYDRAKLADPQNIDFSKYDRINYAFFQPNIDGNLYGTDSWGNPQLLWGPYVTDPALQSKSGANSNYFCSWDGPLGSDDDRNCNYHDIEKGLVFLAHKVGVEVMPSIGGWTLSTNFTTIAASDVKRQNFAKQCVDLIDAYGFDGIESTPLSVHQCSRS